MLVSFGLFLLLHFHNVEFFVGVSLGSLLGRELLRLRVDLVASHVRLHHLGWASHGHVGRSVLLVLHVLNLLLLHLHLLLLHGRHLLRVEPVLVNLHGQVMGAEQNVNVVRVEHGRQLCLQVLGVHLGTQR